MLRHRNDTHSNSRPKWHMLQQNSDCQDSKREISSLNLDRLNILILLKTDYFVFCPKIFLWYIIGIQITFDEFH